MPTLSLAPDRLYVAPGMLLLSLVLWSLMPDIRASRQSPTSCERFCPSVCSMVHDGVISHQLFPACC